MHPEVLYCFPQCAGEKFMPSNGTEGMIFIDAFCSRCIHDDPRENGCKKCDILTRSFLVWPDGLEEWRYNEKGWPTCTEWKFWDWGNDDDGWNEPEPVFPDDPNQLCLPFIFDELEIPKHEHALSF